MHLKTAGLLNRIFRAKDLTLSVAESCTGGLISHYLTALPGASRFLEAGIVCYSNASKLRLIKVPAKVLSLHGAVSGETARSMAEGIRKITKTDVSVSTTGNLGPDVLEDKPKGLVYVAVSTKNGTKVRKLLLKGTREKIKDQAALAALEFMAEVICND